MNTDQLTMSNIDAWVEAHKNAPQFEVFRALKELSILFKEVAQ